MENESQCKNRNWGWKISKMSMNYERIRGKWKMYLRGDRRSRLLDWKDTILWGLSDPELETRGNLVFVS